jgi:serine/threonine protein kinase
MAYMGSNALSASDLNSRLLAGQVIGGRYRVGHLLGEGGMASVWAGTNERTGKRVALKVIRPDFMATPGAEAFLHSEGLAASRVNHPNVVTVFDVIEHEGMACIVMELLDGLPLGTYIMRSGQLNLREATSILLPAMRGVASAHAQGVIHRDLKPQNVFVCIDPDGRVVTTKVLDFGISLMMDWARTRAIATMPGLVGTPAYMAPEHIEGSDRIDERMDVYGFGLLFYESLTARMPFPGEVQTEVLHSVLTETPVPLRELRPDLPPTMVGIVEKAMAKRPEKRFVSLNQMISEIEDLLLSGALPSQSGTPVAGVPAAALSYTVSGPLSLAVPTHGAKENSGLHHETVIFGQSQRPTADENAPDRPIIDERSRKLAEISGMPLLVAAAPGALAPPGALASPPAGFPTTKLSPRGFEALLLHLHDRRILVGIGVALAIVIGTLVATTGRGRTSTRADTSSVGATRQASTSLAAPSAIEPTPPSSAPAAPEPAPAADLTPMPTRAQDGSDRPSAGPQSRPGRGSGQTGKRSASKAGTRAGTLRIDDF